MKKKRAMPRYYGKNVAQNAQRKFLKRWNDERGRNNEKQGCEDIACILSGNSEYDSVVERRGTGN